MDGHFQCDNRPLTQLNFIQSSLFSKKNAAARRQNPVTTYSCANANMERIVVIVNRLNHLALLLHIVRRKI